MIFLQGLGVKIWGTVLNKKTLQIFGAKVAIITSTAVPVIFALVATQHAVYALQEATPCELSVAQQEALQLAGELLLKTSAFANASACSFNNTGVLQHLFGAR